MGLFNWGKRAVQGREDGAGKEAGDAVSSPPVDFDALRRAAATATDTQAMNCLWDATMRLSKWHFIQRGDVASGEARPFCGVVQDKPFLMAFTDGQRANAFGHRNKLYTPADSDAVGVLELPVDAAISTALGLGRHGVFGVLFNDGPAGYFAPITNLVPMYAQAHGMALADAAIKLNEDVATQLHDRFSATGQSEHLQELVAWAFKQPSWFVLADPTDNARPKIWTTAWDATSATAVFTDRNRLQFFAETGKHTQPGTRPPTLELPPRAAAEMIHTLATTGVLKAVVLNGRVPIGAEFFDSFAKVFASK